MHVLLFDIDGTLVHTAGAGQVSMSAALTEEFQVASPQDVPVHGCTDRGIARDLFRTHGIDDTAGHWRRLHDAYVRHLSAELPCRPGRVLPGVEALLSELQLRGDVALGLLTGNVREAARLKLAHFQLDHYFTFGAFGDHRADRNELAHDAVEQWRRRSGAADGERFWVVGDTPLDVRCGRAIGARVVAVATGAFTRGELRAERPDVLLDDLQDRSCFLRQLAKLSS